MIAASVSAAILWYYVNNQRWDYLRLLLSLIFIARGFIYPKCHYSPYISFKISNKNDKLCYENRWSRCRFWKCHLSLPFIELLCPFMSLFFFSLFILLRLQLCVLMSIVQVESNWKISSCLFCMAMCGRMSAYVLNEMVLYWLSATLFDFIMKFFGREKINCSRFVSRI